VSLFRIGGIASGIDTNGLIDQLMALERRPIYLMQSKKQKLDWKKEYWSDIQTSLKALDSSIDNLLKKATMMARSTTTGDETVATATATSDAALGKYTINILDLATSTSLTSGGGVSGLGVSGKIDANMPISSYTSKFNTNPTTGTFTVNGVQFTLSDTDSDSLIDTIEAKRLSDGSTTSFQNLSGSTLNDVVNAFNDATVSSWTNVTASYNSDTDKLTLTHNSGGDVNLGSGSDTSNFLSAASLLNSSGTSTRTSVSHLGRIRTSQPLADANFQTAITGDVNGDGSFKINDVEITYNINNDTLQKIIDRINASAAGVNASYDSINDKMILTNKNTGSTSINTADVSGNFLSSMYLLSGTGATESLGKNARFTINGGDEMASLTNDVSSIVAGVTFQLKKIGQTDITIDKDTSKAKEAIKDFVNKYNAALALINAKLTEEKVKDPQTSSDAKKGLLKGDRDLAQIKNRLVSKSTSLVAGLSASMDHLSEIGITLTSDDFGKSGTLVLDETKLDEKLNENPGGVASLFFNDLDGDGKVDAGEDGVAARLDSYMLQLLDTGGTTTVSRIEDSEVGNITYIGTWNSVADASASGGSIRESSSAGDIAKFSFTGSAVTWFATKDVGLGVAEVWIDGVYKQDVDLSSASKQNKQSVYSISGLSYGSHTIEIKVKSGAVNIDAIDATFTSSTGAVPGVQNQLTSQSSAIDKQIEAMETRLAKREETLIKQFTAMELALQRLQDMSARFEMQIKGMFGG